MIKCIMNEITQNTKHSVTAVQTVFNRSYILSNNKYSVVFLKVNIQAFIKKKKIVETCKCISDMRNQVSEAPDHTCLQ